MLLFRDINTKKRDLWNKCTVCGKFISYKDFLNDKAKRYMVTPDSGLSFETWETLCYKHRNNQGIRSKDVT